MPFLHGLGVHVPSDLPSTSVGPDPGRSGCTTAEAHELHGFMRQMANAFSKKPNASESLNFAFRSSQDAAGRMAAVMLCTVVMPADTSSPQISGHYPFSATFDNLNISK